MQYIIANVRSFMHHIIMPPPLIGGALSDDAVWRLSVAYIGP